MFVSRRGLLVGAAGIITSSFIQMAKTRIERTGVPLLLDPKKVRQKLFVNNHFSDEGEFRAELGEPERGPESCKRCTWLEFARVLYHDSRQPPDLTRFCQSWKISPSQLNDLLPRGIFEDVWFEHLGPTARAYKLLSHIDLGPDLDGAFDHDGSVWFVNNGRPGLYDTWVAEVPDELSISLLQARLIELGLPVKIVVA